MKSFKLVGLGVVVTTNGVKERHDIPLIDGIIINKEDYENKWIVEAFMIDSYAAYFYDAHEEGSSLHIQATITNQNNDAANLSARVIRFTTMTGTVSILLEGTMMRQRTNASEIVLKKLIDSGLSGDALFEQFRRELNIR